MTEAAVGFQCPECVAQGRASVRTARTPFGGRIDARATVTLTLIGICVAVFGVEFLTGVNQVLNDYGSWPFGIAFGGEQWRLFTAMFLHVNLLHLLFNMYVLYLLGPQLERLFGHTRFLVLFLVSGLGGSVASYWFSEPNTVSAGASGAIFGLMAALVVAGHAIKADITQVLVLIGINLAIGFLVGGIDWRAHLGGLVTGAAVAAVLAYAPRPQRTLVQAVGVGLIVAALLLAVVVRTSQLQDQLSGLLGR
jgi:membrane associated rhomboid family serine protease